MTLLRAVLVDDESLARDRMRRLLTELDGVRIVGEAPNAAQALPLIVGERPDVVFLDVQMPGLDGFELAQAIAAEYRPFLVFVTAYADAAVRAFDVAAMDFLVKPVERERLQHTLARVHTAIDERRETPPSERALPGAGTAEDMLAQFKAFGQPVQYLERFAVTVGKRTQFLRTADVDWFQADDNYVRVSCNGKIHLVRATLGSIEAQLNPTVFVRLHRSVIVQLDRMLEVRVLPSGEWRAVLPGNVQFEVGRPYRDRLPGAPGKPN